MSAIATELQLRIQGVSEAVRGMNQVADASRRMKGEVTGGMRVSSGSGGLARGVFAGSGVGLAGGALGFAAGASFAFAASQARNLLQQQMDFLESHNARLRERGYEAQSYWGMLFGASNEWSESALRERGERLASSVGGMIKRIQDEFAQRTGTESLQQWSARFARDNPKLSDLEVEMEVMGEFLRRQMDESDRRFFDRRQKAIADTEERARRFNEYFAEGQGGDFGGALVERETRTQARERQSRNEQKRREMERDLERGEQMQRRAREMALADFNAGPRYAGIALAGSHEARMDAAREEWEKSFDLQETANDYLRQILDKTEATVIYGIN
jgi:hypothetical protein